MISTVVIVGTGNVAWHMASKLSEAKIETLVLGRNETARQDFTNMEHVHFYTSKTDRMFDAQVILLCVSDDAVQHSAQFFNGRIGQNQVIAHTSGTLEGNILYDITGHWGSFWPVQTLRKGSPPQSGIIPVVITAGSMFAQTWLTALAQIIHSPFVITDDGHKKHLHLSAVLVNNFTNHLMALAEKYCTDHNVDFTVLRPLILETALKVQHQNPANTQTGPAARGDQSTLERHMAMLTDLPELKTLYTLFTTSISKMYHEDH